MALFTAETADNHKALNLRILDVSTQCGYADYFVIASATSTRHAQALADAIYEDLNKKRANLEGYTKGEWVLVDLDSVIVHIFFEPIRNYYNFDKLWGKAPVVVRTQGKVKKVASSTEQSFA